MKRRYQRKEHSGSLQKGRRLPNCSRLFSLCLCGYFFFCVARCHAQTSLPAALQDVGIDQLLGQQVPLDLSFIDESGRQQRLRESIADRPTLLVLVYYRCPMLCNLELNGLAQAIRTLPLGLGDDYRVLAVSIDPKEDPKIASAKKTNYVREIKIENSADGWRFLTGTQENITTLAASVGFRYKFDTASGEYSHAAGLIVLTPQGRIARYFPGVEYAPRELRLALVEASNRRIGTASDQFFLFCFHYDPASGRYTLAVRNILRVAGVATVGGIVLLIVRLSSHRRRAFSPVSSAGVSA